MHFTEFSQWLVFIRGPLAGNHNHKNKTTNTYNTVILIHILSEPKKNSEDNVQLNHNHVSVYRVELILNKILVLI